MLSGVVETQKRVYKEETMYDKYTKKKSSEKLLIRQDIIPVDLKEKLANIIAASHIRK